MKKRSFHAPWALARLAAAAGVSVALTSAAAVVGGAVTGIDGPVAGASPAATAAAGTCSAKALTRAAELKLTMVNSSAGKVPTISVCLDGKGPYSFLVSTGAGSSVVTPGLARKLHLKTHASVPVRGVTCVTSAPAATVKKWSMSGAQLKGQRLLVAKFSVPGVSPALKGVIGSDVLERFGAVRIDYDKSRLYVLGAEHAGPKGNVYVLGQKTSTPPSALAGGSIKASAPLRVFESPQGIIVAVPVKFSRHTEQMAVDSGSPGSGILTSVARGLKLKPASAKAAATGIGCTGSASTYSSGPWFLGAAGIAGATLSSQPIAGSINSGLQGVIGSRVLSADGAVIIDYEGAHLWLATG